MIRIRTVGRPELEAALVRKARRKAHLDGRLRVVLAVLLVTACWPVSASRVEAANAEPASALAGEPAASAATAPDASGERSPASGDEELHELLAEGADVFVENCAECHGTAGAGTGAGPRLVGNDDLQNAPRVTRQVLFGGDMMPSFGTHLTDHEVAAVLTYVRNSWGNDFGVLTEEEVIAERKRFE